VEFVAGCVGGWQQDFFCSGATEVPAQPGHPERTEQQQLPLRWASAEQPQACGWPNDS